MIRGTPWNRDAWAMRCSLCLCSQNLAFQLLTARFRELITG
jgi:hypothetical protein